MIDKKDIISALRVIDKMKPLARKRAEMSADDWREYIEVYAMMLSGIDDPDVLKAAIVQVLSDHPYPDWPQAADILQAAYKIIERSMDLPTAGEAWEIVLTEIRRIGVYGKPEFENQMIAAAARSMGWRQMCLSEAPAGVDRGQFAKIFNALHNRAVQDHRTHPLVAAQIESLRGERLGLDAGEKVKELTEKLSTNRQED